MRSVRLFLLGIAVVTLLRAACAQTLTFNAEWWNHALSDEQQGFIYGYQDCRQPAHAAAGSINDYQEFISQYIRSNRVSDTQSVPFAIRVAETKLNPRTVLKGGEVWKGPHGYLDGGWWGLPNLDSLYQQNGFVEGYVYCATGTVNAKSVDAYVKTINRHYAKPKTEHDSIASVLQHLLRSNEISRLGFGHER